MVTCGREPPPCSQEFPHNSLLVHLLISSWYILFFSNVQPQVFRFKNTVSVAT